MPSDAIDPGDCHIQRDNLEEPCRLQEVQQREDIIDASAAIMDDVVIQRLVLSSLTYARRSSGVNFTWMYNFEFAAARVQFLEARARESPQCQALYVRKSCVEINYRDDWRGIYIQTSKVIGTWKPR